MTLYVDGQKVAEGTASDLLKNNPKQAMEIGSDEGTAVGDYKGQNGFTGAIDEVRLYFASVDSEAVKARFENGDELNADPALVVSFDDETGQDLSIHKNQGTLQNGKPVPGKFGKAMTFVASNNRGGGNRNNAPSQIEPKWTSDIPIYVRGMCLADRTLFVVGPEDIINEEETFEKLTNKDKAVNELLAKQDAILEGANGSQLLAVNADSGEVRGTVQLETLPAWDGLAAAQEKLFLSTLDGSVICFSGED